MKYLIIIIGLLLCLAADAAHASTKGYAPWIVYYSDKAPAETFTPYNLIVFDSEYHPPLKLLLDKQRTLLGYLSLGELENERSYFYEAKNNGLLLKENTNWPGSYVVDIRQRAWATMVVEQFIPEILTQGFNGIYLDTLDSPLALERENPKYYGGMKQAAINLVKTIRQHYPSIKIMVNRAYEILPEAAPYVDMQLGEAIYTDYNLNAKTYQATNAYLYKKQVALLQNARRINPKLGIFTLDYWNQDDKEQIKHIYETQNDNGFYPYVSTVMLDTVMEEPE